jgi:hypothetical protein
MAQSIANAGLPLEVQPVSSQPAFPVPLFMITSPSI